MVVTCTTNVYVTSIKWYKKNGHMSTKILSDNEGRLKIPSVSVDDEGKYVCVARNQYGVNKTEFTLVVLSGMSLQNFTVVLQV